MGISKSVVQGAVILNEARNWEVLEQCQDVLEKQSSGLDLLKTLASERVTRNNSLRFPRDRDGHIVSASFCQCIPDPTYPHKQGSEVSLNLVAKGKGFSTWTTPETWLSTWSAWQSKNCDLVTLNNGTKFWRGGGSWTRKRLKDLDARSWEEEVEEISCPNTVLHARCFEYEELNSRHRRTWEGSHQYRCDRSAVRTHSDWKGAGWYRITGKAGTKLAESPVEDYHCGTIFGGWMSGGHPTVDQGEVSRTINFKASNGTTLTNQAKVINCGTYYVYHLDNVPICNGIETATGYCTE